MFEIRPETEPRKLILELSKAPLLKKLRLCNGRMTLTDWENIAYYAPQLEVLCFDDMIIERPYSQKSNTSKLKEFHASNCSKQSNELILLSLVDKYKTLETLRIHRVENEEDDGDGCLHLKKHLNCLLATIVSQNPALKTYVIDLSPESYELKKVCSQDVSECEKTLRIAIESLTAEPEYEPNSMDGVRRTLFNKSNA
ncbi:hypothetical protein [Parasitella parasitica]|uniref:Uncharacterized protein n=1 Tax=Parasitella parasitica TaxID=35722 RepID=A0A0B7N9D4_9FUNG|nr:hypothetical protein [Parasitella parasitica]